MSLYPTLEDLTVDNMAKAQIAHAQYAQRTIAAAPAGTPVAVPAGSLYASLYTDVGLDDYMGVSLAQYQQVASQYAVTPYAPTGMAVAPPSQPMSQAVLGIKRAEIKDGVRQLSICRDGKGKMGIAVKSINKGVFVSGVWKDSPASLAGLRVGDQILQIDGENVAGYDSSKALNTLKKAPGPQIAITVRDRPFERIITMKKDSTEHMGFVFHNGKINKIVKDSSAARNGLLIEHNFLEVNGINVVGLPDKDVLDIIAQSGDTVTLTVMPSFIFETLVKNLSDGMLRKLMDRSVPDI